jgi:elongation factor P hydroxylase
MTHHYQDLIRLFNCAFAHSENTVLVKGADEPVYLATKDPLQPNQILFAHGYFASALHEIAHWCIAGKTRRMLDDYGYWYCEDGRNAQQQAEFQRVEVKPQAIEWAFCQASNKPFRVSTDNLNGAPVDEQQFVALVRQQVLYYLDSGFPERAASFIQVLHGQYQTSQLHKVLFNE